jgi:hypothetical protein
MSASIQARHAVRAAKNFNRWGPKAATVYASKRNVPVSMFCMAIGFEERRAKRAQGGAA